MQKVQRKTKSPGLCLSHFLLVFCLCFSSFHRSFSSLFLLLNLLFYVFFSLATIEFLSAAMNFLITVITIREYQYAFWSIWERKRDRCRWKKQVQVCFWSDRMDAKRCVSGGKGVLLLGMLPPAPGQPPPKLPAKAAAMFPASPLVTMLHVSGMAHVHAWKCQKCTHTRHTCLPSPSKGITSSNGIP